MFHLLQIQIFCWLNSVNFSLISIVLYFKVLAIPGEQPLKPAVSCWICIYPKYSVHRALEKSLYFIDQEGEKNWPRLLASSWNGRIICELAKLQALTVTYRNAYLQGKCVNFCSVFEEIFDAIWLTLSEKNVSLYTWIFKTY